MTQLDESRFNKNELSNEENTELAEKILVYLKTDEVVELSNLKLDHLVGNVYEEWEYAGFSDPLGQATATIINTITGALKPIIDAVKGVVDSIWSKVVSIYDYVKDIPSKITELANRISSFVNQIVSNVGSVVRTIVEDAFNTVRSALTSVENAIGNVVQAVQDTVGSIVRSLESTIRSMATSVENTIRSTFSSVRNAIERVTSELRNVSQAFVSKLTELGTTIQRSVQDALRTVFESIQSVLQGIAERVRSGFEAVQNTFTVLLHQIESTLGNLPRLFESFSKSLQNTIGSIVGKIVETVKNLPSAIGKLVEDIFQTFRTWFSSIMDGIGQISATFRGFINPLVGIQNWLESKLRDVWKWIYENVAKPVYESVLKPVVDAIKSFIGDPLGTLRSAFEKVFDFFENIKEKAKELFAPIVNAIESFVKDPLGAIADAIKPLMDFFNNLRQKAGELFAPIVDALSKIDLSGVVKFFDDVKNAIGKAWTDAWSWISDAFDKVRSFFENDVLPAVKGIVEWIVKGVTNIANWIASVLGEIVSKSISTFKGLTRRLFVDPMLAVLGIDKWISDNEKILKRCLFGSPTNKAQQGFNLLLETIVLANLPLEVLALYWLSSAVEDAGGLIKFVEAKITPILARFGITIDPSKLRAGSTELGKMIAKEWTKAILFTTSFWIYEPFKYWVNPFVRWTLGLPHEIPTYHEIVHSTRRFLPCKALADEGAKEYAEMFNTMIKHLHEIMDYRAFPFWFEAITLGEHAPEDVMKVANIPNLFSFKITDRFGKEREIPMLLLYELPTPSDTVRMMLRDVIQNLNDFEKIMLAHGFKRDITAMYYLLHFKYPSPSALFEFISRVAGEVVWFEPKGTAEQIVESETKNFESWGLGFKPRSPIDLTKEVSKYALPKPSQTPASIDTSKIDEVVLSRFNEIVGYIMPYFKWHDYFPMAWIENFTSDQMIAIELSADIPQRIDARWMFKWGIISDTDLLRIVMARGMHPAWASKITIAEIMNAMSEERTVVRTGIINAFKEGFTTEENLKNQFKHLCDLEILGVKVPVIFLEGEAKLLTLRAKYDRAIDILRDLVRQCVHGYQHNIYDFNTFKSKIKKVLDNLAKTLDIPLAFDEKYFNAYKEYLDVYHEVDTINRIRSWIRYSMYQLLYRFTRGYVPKSEAKKLVDLFVEFGKLTEEEKEVFEKLMGFMLEGYVNEVKVRAILRKLSRGVISLDDAKKELKKLDIPDDLVDALIEAYARQYTLSISSYLAYADYVPIDEKLLVKKLELLGVPEDERRIILEVFKIKPIRTEMSRAIERLLDLFEEGYVSENELKNLLSEYRLSRVGIEFLVLASKFKKQEKKAKLYVDAIIHEFKRGAISLREAREKLRKVIKDDEIIDYVLEKNARIYEFSVDKLISMREYVPIDVGKVIEKAKEFGYPDDEVKLIPAYVVARELDEEIKRVANELGNDFVNGVITEQEFRKALDELATLNGQAKSKLGVDWIVLSPEERELLVTLYKLRKMRKEKRR